MLPQSPFAALQHRNFRLLWTGQLISFSGSHMQTAALLWHVSLLVPPAQRPIALGMVGLVRLMPIIFFSIAGGTLADASDRRRVMLFTQSAMALTALALAVLSFRGLSHPWPIYALAAIGAAAGAFDSPARQSLMPTLVPRDHLPNAISLNAIMVQVASVAGPAIGGLIIATLGVEWVYAVNALTFVCVIVALLMMRDVPERSLDDISDFSVRAVREGFGFVFSSPIIRSTMLLDFFATFFSSATALLPIFAQDVLHVGARGYGWLYAAPSVGAVLMSLVMVRSIERIERRGVVLIWAVCVVRRSDNCVRIVPLVPAHVSVPRRHRRGRYGQHGAAQCDSSARHARSPARPHDRHQHGVLPGRPSARRARGRRRRTVDRSARIGGHRRHRLPHRHGLDCRPHARAQTISPQLD